MSEPPRAHLAAPLVCLAIYATALRWAPPDARPSTAPAAVGPKTEELRRWVEEEKLALREERWADALPVAERLHRLFPANHVYVADLANVHHALGHHREEAEMWERYLEVAPVPVHACPRIAFAYLRQRRLADYRRAAERCLSFDPKNTDSLFSVGHASELAGDLSRARFAYEHGLTLAPGYTDLTLGLGRVDLREGKLADAERRAREALASRPNDAEAEDLLRRVLASRGNRP